MRGYITPTTTGDYWFWIASDDNGELWLSTDADPAHKTRIAYVPGYTGSREWTKYSQQKSALKHLVAGTRYYVEALMKEGGGSDNLAVTWQLSGGTFDGLPIASTYLTPFVETSNALSVTPTINALTTADTTPPLAGSVNDPNVAVTVGLAGRYYAATRDTGTTWLLPDGAIQPPLAAGTYDVTVCATDTAARTAFDATTNELLVDTLAPTATSAVPNLTTIADANVGTGTLSVTVVYSEAMNGTAAPTLTFTPDVTSPPVTLTFNAGASRWSNSTTYVATYNVADAEVTVPGVGIGVALAQDLAGNVQVPYSGTNNFSINTQGATVVGAIPDRTTITDANVGVPAWPWDPPTLAGLEDADYVQRGDERR